MPKIQRLSATGLFNDPSSSPLQGCLSVALSKTAALVRCPSFDRSGTSSEKASQNQNCPTERKTRKNLTNPVTDVFAFIANGQDLAAALACQFRELGLDEGSRLNALIRLVEEDFGQEVVSYERLVEASRAGGVRDIALQYESQIKGGEVPRECKGVMNILEQFAESMMLKLENHLYGKFRKEMRRLVERHAEAQALIAKLNGMILDQPRVMFGKQAHRVQQLEKENRELRVANKSLSSSLQQLRSRLLRMANRDEGESHRGRTMKQLQARQQMLERTLNAGRNYEYDD